MEPGIRVTQPDSVYLDELERNVEELLASCQHRISLPVSS